MLILSFTIIGLVIFIFWAKRTPSRKSGNASINNLNNLSPFAEKENQNYVELRLLFLHSLISHRVDNSQVVSGIFVETYLNENKRIIFASNINGWTGYYQSTGGGIIGGKWYSESTNPFLLQELMRRYPLLNELSTDFQKPEIRTMVTDLTFLANDLLIHTEQDNNYSPVRNPDSVKIWFFTRGDFHPKSYLAEFSKINFHNSYFKEIILKSCEIILESNSYEGSINSDIVSRELRLLLNL
jgi:hypothetical protein